MSKLSRGVLVLLFLLASALSLHVSTPTAQAAPVYYGITDTGKVSNFKREEQRLQFHFPLLQTFHPWGNKLNQAIPRWNRLQVRPMLHIATVDDETRRQLITPEGIWRGQGDGYLKRLNRELAAYGKPVFLRPMGEANRLWNAYSAYNFRGHRRGSKHSFTDYKQAFRRIYTIVKGGSRRAISKQLKSLRMPGLRGRSKRLLPQPKVNVIWSPLPGNQGIRGNGPVSYWPGGRFVDTVGTSFFSAWPEWSSLNRFYRQFGRNKPFSISEWGLNSDDPGFASKLTYWCLRRSNCRSMVYYRGFDDGYELRNYPQSENTIRQLLDSKQSLLEFYPEWLRENRRWDS